MDGGCQLQMRGSGTRLQLRTFYVVGCNHGLDVSVCEPLLLVSADLSPLQ